MVTNFINLKFSLAILLLISNTVSSIYSLASDHKLIPSIYIFGDSHAQYNFTNQRVWQEDYNFISHTTKLKVNFKIHSFSGKSMYHLGLEGLNFLNITNYGVRANDIVLFNFGDMDCRMHILKQCERQNKSIDDIITLLVDKYFALILLNQQQVKGAVCAVMSVIPPCQPCSGDPVNIPGCYGTIEKRIQVTRAMNLKLAQMCAKSGLLFVDTYDVYSDTDGKLPANLSDGNMHINLKLNEPLKERVVQILLNNNLIAQTFPTNKILITHQREGDLGDKVATFCNAYILAQKYNLPFYYQPFRDSNLFLFDDNLHTFKKSYTGNLADYHTIKILSETELINNLDNYNIIFEVALNTQINHIAPELIKNLKQILQLKHSYSIGHIPKDRISIAVHIRKGNGGGQFYDGQLVSEQLFEFDRSQVKYETSYDRYPFQWELDLTYPDIKNHPAIAYGDMSGPLLLDKVAYVFDLKFPPEQYYIDQLIKISNDLGNPLIFAQIFTDDKDPIALVERLKTKLNKPNIKLYYLDNRHENYSDRIAYDLSIMSQCNGLIRSQSYFSRAAEMIGNHKFVIFPMGSIWQDNKRIINRIITKQIIDLVNY